MQKNALFLNFFAKLFGQFKKKQYLCTRFREMRGEILKNAEVLCKLSESMLLQLNEAKALDFSGGKGGNSSVGRARPCQGRGREFESRFPLKGKKTAEIAQLVEHDLAKVGVAGSSPVFRSRFF